MKTPNKTNSSGKAAAAKKSTSVQGQLVSASIRDKAATATTVKTVSTKTVKVPNKPAPKPVPSKKPALVDKAVVASSATNPSPAKAVDKAKSSRSSPPQLAPTQSASPIPKVKTMSVTKVETPPSPAESAPASVAAAPEQFVRATRPSARLAQITVPSLPPAVASTAAKSSFLPNTAPVVAAVPFAPIKKDPKLANNWKTKKAEELSDAEILAMPDDEYMNDKQMAYFRLKLTQLKQDILASAGQTTEHLREDTVVVPDPADRATIEEEHALELRTRDRERKLLKKIEQSIHRIDAGDYGFCDETGEAIGVGRLLARPTATLSLEAQQRRELKQKMFGD